MKVKDLKIGMVLEPVNQHQWSIAFRPATLSVFRGLGRHGLPEKYAVYLGQRKDLDIPIACCWSNRYCLFDGQILPVDQVDWPYIQPAK